MMMVLLPVLSPLTYGQARDRAALLEKQKKVTEGLVRWEATLVALERKLAPRVSLTDRQMVRHLRKVRRAPQRASIQTRSEAMLKLVTVSQLSNTADLSRLADQSWEIQKDTTATARLLDFDFGPRLQRQTSEKLDRELAIIAKAQKEIEDKSLPAEGILKEQYKTRKDTIRWFEQISAEGEGTGAIGKHLRNAKKSVQKLIQTQRNVERLASEGHRVRALKKITEVICESNLSNSKIQSATEDTQGGQAATKCDRQILATDRTQMKRG
ncbi:MAG: hypothetical protein HYX68_26415 [Planctomycetes bacterium]|nr:hypothetical protein [Planctomycetota bacterium]